MKGTGAMGGTAAPQNGQVFVAPGSAVPHVEQYIKIPSSESGRIFSRTIADVYLWKYLVMEQMELLIDTFYLLCV